MGSSRSASAPVIYAMGVPLVILDVAITAYQALCFPLYGIAPVRRSQYLVFGRHRLGYLDAIEKFNGEYCSYANGILAYAREIAARTEQYWSPIRHARDRLSAHSRYGGFLAFGDVESHRTQLRGLRESLREIEEC